MTPNLPRIRQTLLRCIETEEFEFGRHSDLDEARGFLRDLERQWPSLESVPAGEDIFKDKYPVTGAPVDNKQSAL